MNLFTVTQKALLHSCQSAVCHLHLVRGQVIKRVPPSRMDPALPGPSLARRCVSVMDSHCLLLRRQLEDAGWLNGPGNFFALGTGALEPFRINTWTHHGNKWQLFGHGLAARLRGREQLLRFLFSPNLIFRLQESFIWSSAAG